MDERSAHPSFAEAVLPHLDAAYNLAHWLLGNRRDAEDAVQEAMVRALTYYSGFRGVNPRAWLLRIVRNAAYAALRERPGGREVAAPTAEGEPHFQDLVEPSDGPEAALTREVASREVAAALARLPPSLREVLILREVEELSYRDIARVTEAPVGTVMSRLWRARRALAEILRRADLAP